MQTREYQPREFWSDVAQEIRQRPTDSEMAGDDTPFYRYKRGRFLIEFLDSMPVQGQRLLEVGCGPGGNLRRIAQAEPRHLVGCDVSPAMADLARRTTRDLPGVEIVEVNGKELPFVDRSFDVVFTVTVLQHNSDSMLADLLPEICRVAASRVYLFEDTGNRKRAGYSFFLRPVSEYASVCALSGFRLVKADVLPIHASESAANFIGAALPRNRREGTPKSGAQVLLETAALPLTKVLDHAITPRGGLTRMVFERQ
jgi:SAM-dependent methyltransferase